MNALDVRTIRSRAGLSRPELARFLGVSERTVARWETDDTASEPGGVQGVLLRALSDALAHRPAPEVARVVRSSSHDHRRSIQALLEAAG